MKKTMYIYRDKAASTLAHLQELVGDKELEVAGREVVVLGLNEKAKIEDSIFESREVITSSSLQAAVEKAWAQLSGNEVFIYIPRRFTNIDAVQIIAVAIVTQRRRECRFSLMFPDSKTGEYVKICV